MIFWFIPLGALVVALVLAICWCVGKVSFVTRGMYGFSFGDVAWHGAMLVLGTAIVAMLLLAVGAGTWALLLQL